MSGPKAATRLLPGDGLGFLMVCLPLSVQLDLLTLFAYSRCAPRPTPGGSLSSSLTPP